MVWEMYTKGNSEMGGKTVRSAVPPVAQLTGHPRLSWAQEGPFPFHPPHLPRPPKGPLSLYFLTLPCPASQSFQGQGTSMTLVPREIFIPPTLAFESTSKSAESPGRSHLARGK